MYAYMSEQNLQSVQMY